MTKDEEIRAIKREAGRLWARIERDYLDLRYTEARKYAQQRLAELKNRLKELEGSMMMSKEVDKAIRWEMGRTTRDAARLIFKVGTRKEDKIAKLQAQIDELRAEVKDNRGDFTYAEALKKLEDLETELKGERGDSND